MSKVLSMRVDDDVYSFYRENSEEVRNEFLLLIRKMMNKKRSSVYRRLKFYLDTKLENQDVVTALEVYNRLKINETDLLSLLEQYAFDNDDVILDSPDTTDDLSINQILNMVKIKKRVRK